MKKSVALLLAAILCVTLAACGNKKSNTIDETAHNDKQTSVTETDAPVTQAAETDAPETSTSDTDIAETQAAETDAPAPSFNTSWAGESYEMPVPEPPFLPYVSFSENQNMYTVINSDTAEEITYDSIAAYCVMLKSIGFTDIELDVLTESEFNDHLNQTGGAATAFIAKNGDGARVVINKEFSTWMVMVYCPKAGKAPEASAFDTAWAANEFEALLPKLPFDGWTSSQESDSVYKMERGGMKDSVITDENGNSIGYGEDKTALIAYLESLKDYGFSVKETGGIEGYEYEWSVTDPKGNHMEFVAAEGYCWITITKK